MQAAPPTWSTPLDEGTVPPRRRRPLPGRRLRLRVSEFYRRATSKSASIWIDAHSDINTPETSPSGNVHGMPLAALLGLGPEPLGNIFGYSPKVAAENTGKTVAGNNMDAFAYIWSSTSFASSPSRNAKQLWQHFNDCYFNARQVQSFAGFYADQPTADDYGFSDFFLIPYISKIIGIFHAL